MKLSVYLNYIFFIFVFDRPLYVISSSGKRVKKVCVKIKKREKQSFPIL